jgi:hypothetical protein
MVLERWTKPKLSRSPRCKLRSWRGKSAGVAKRCVSELPTSDSQIFSLRCTPNSRDALSSAAHRAAATLARLVKGLEECERLEELHINRQRLDPLGPGLQFDPMCMRLIANSLCVLKAQVSHSDLHALTQLRKFGF